jgi:hypothetical protein
MQKNNTRQDHRWRVVKPTKSDALLCGHWTEGQKTKIRLTLGSRWFHFLLLVPSSK